MADKTQPTVLTCPRCHSSLTCLAQEIECCDCTQISLGGEVRLRIKQRYQACLCVGCLKELKSEIENAHS